MWRPTGRVSVIVGFIELEYVKKQPEVENPRETNPALLKHPGFWVSKIVSSCEYDWCRGSLCEPISSGFYKKIRSGLMVRRYTPQLARRSAGLFTLAFLSPRYYATEAEGDTAVGVSNRVRVSNAIIQPIGWISNHSQCRSYNMNVKDMKIWLVWKLEYTLDAPQNIKNGV